MKKLSALLACCVLWISIYAQFNNVSGANSINFTSFNPFHGSGCAFVDFDGDGWDDLTYSAKNASPKFFKNNNGVFTPITLTFDPAMPANADGKMPLWFDYDNDGDKDFLYTIALAPVRLYRNNGNGTFTEVATSAGLISESPRHMGASTCDYDRDGFLDLFICKYHNHLIDVGPVYTNRLYHNNGNGTFSEVSVEAGIPQTVQASFMSAFFDYDNDGWPDLYVINDKIVYPNFLFHNNGDGTFTNVTTTSGAGIYMDAMSITIEDYDHDSDMDIFITNTDSKNVLLQNQGDGTFDDVAVAAGVWENDATTVTWGALFLDYDNNTWDDLFVGTLGTGVSLAQQCDFYINDGDGTFTLNQNAVGLMGAIAADYTSAMGDMNNDGYFDFINNNASPSVSALWQNDGGTNNWFGLTVTGVISNRDAIGTLIELWAGGEKYVRYTMAGENYMCQNSEREVFGLANETTVDSLKLTWPSGLEEWYYQPSINTYHQYVEGESLANVIVPLSADGGLAICPGQSVTISIDTDAEVIWSNDLTGASITVDQPGIYSATFVNEYGFTMYSDTLTVSLAVDPELEYLVTNVSCHNGNNGEAAVVPIDEELDSIIWNNDSTTFSLTGLTAGTYSFSAIFNGSCETSGSITVNEPDSLGFVYSTLNVSCYGNNDGSASVDSIFGGIPDYSVDWFGADPNLLPAGEYPVSVEDANGCQTTMLVTINQPDLLIAEIDGTGYYEGGEPGTATLDIGGGTPPYSILWSNGEVNVDVVDSLDAGFYSVVVTDSLGCMWTDSFEIDYIEGVGESDDVIWNLYPNPANDYIVFVSTGNYKLSILDCTGHQVMIKQSVGSTTLDVSELASGCYFLQCTDPVSNLTKQVRAFTIQH